MQEPAAVILTREGDDNLTLEKGLKERGILFLRYPCIQTRPVPFTGKFVEEIPVLEGWPLTHFQVVVFTSRRGVAGVANFVSQLSSLPLAVVGPGTAAAVAQKIRVEPTYIAEPSTAEALAEQLVKRLTAPGPILHIRGSKSTGIFKKVMETAGFNVVELVVYKNQSPDLEPLPADLRGIVVFASPSAAANFFKFNSSQNDGLIYLAIGPTTAGYLKRTLKERFQQKIFQAPKPDPNSLVETISGIMDGESQISIENPFEKNTNKSIDN